MKTILRTTALFLIFAVSFYSCTEKIKIEPFLTVDETPVTANTEAGTYSIVISSNGEWTAIVENAAAHDWCTLTNASGSENGTLTVNLAENTTLTARSATVKITSEGLTKSVVFTQKGTEPFLIVDETSITATAEAGTYSIVISSNGEWTAIVENAAAHDWCTLTNASGSGNGVITVDVAENTVLATRNATVKITLGDLNKSVQVIQEAAEPFLTVDETPIFATAEAKTYSITVNSNGEWTAIIEDAANHDWCTLTNASSNGNGTIIVNVPEYLIPITRSATVKIISGNFTKYVVVNQNLLTENSVWKCTGYVNLGNIELPEDHGISIELTFYPSENKVHIISICEEKPPTYPTHSLPIVPGKIINEVVDYRIEIANPNSQYDYTRLIINYLPWTNFDPWKSWKVTILSKNEIHLEEAYLYGDPPMWIIRIYHFIRQTN